MLEVSEWRKALLPSNSSIQDAIKVLIDGSLRIVLVADSDLILRGTITDGDIRRGLLRNLVIDSPISEIMNHRPIVVPDKLNREEVLRIMSANKILQIPIVDESFKLQGLHSWENLSTPAKRDNVMVIMAGGKGTRLLPKTKNTPKPMLTLGGKPILQHIIEEAKAEGFTKFMIAIHHLGKVIEEHFGNGDSYGVNISYVRENSPLGTAGALGLLDPLPTNPIVVTNGDVLAELKYADLLDFHVQNNSQATMAVKIHGVQVPYGVVKTNGLEITEYEEKPTQKFLVNAGVYVIEPSCLAYLPSSKSVNMPEFFESLTINGLKTLAFLVHERWMDIGGHDEFAKAAKILKNFGKEQNGLN